MHTLEGPSQSLAGMKNCHCFNGLYRTCIVLVIRILDCKTRSTFRSVVFEGVRLPEVLWFKYQFHFGGFKFYSLYLPAKCFDIAQMSASIRRCPHDGKEMEILRVGRICVMDSSTTLKN